MQTDKPYFLKNSKWFTFNEEECRYELTEGAPAEAVKSYEEFYALLEDEWQE